MRKPVVGVIANTYRIENRFDIQSVGERNLRAVADVAGDLQTGLGPRPVCRTSPTSRLCSKWSTESC